MSNSDTAQSNDWHRVTLCIVALLILIVGAFVWIRPETTTERNELLRTLLTAIGATALLIQLRYTHESTRAATRTLEVTEQGQLTDRFYKAVEQLGSKSSDVRMGALFALERIAHDSPRDRDQVLSIVSAFVRQRAPLSKEQQLDPPSGSKRVNEDVQCAVMILGRNLGSPTVSDVDSVDLSYTDLTGIRLRGAHFADARFEGCYFDDAEFIDCSFANAMLRGVTARGARFVVCDLRSTNFSFADLSGASISDMYIPDKPGVHVSQTVRVKGLLRNTEFWETNLKQTRFFVDDLSETRGLRQRQLERATIPQHTPLPTNSIWWDLDPSES